MSLQPERCHAQHLNALVDAQSRVINALDDPSLFEPRSTAQIRGYVSSPHSVVLACREGEDIVAYAFLLAEDDASDELVTVVREQEVEGDLMVCDAVAVCPSHRGQGLQRRLTSVAAGLALHAGADWIVASVAPTNRYALANLRHSGFEEIAVTPLYGGERHAILRFSLR